MASGSAASSGSARSSAPKASTPPKPSSKPSSILRCASSFRTEIASERRDRNFVAGCDTHLQAGDAGGLVAAQGPLLLVHGSRVHGAAAGALAAVAPLRDPAGRTGTVRLLPAQLDTFRRFQRYLLAVRAVPQHHVPPAGRCDSPLQGDGQTCAVGASRCLAVWRVARGIDSHRRRSDRVREVSAKPKAVQKPALAHLFWWFMFSQGGLFAAVLLPVHIVVQGILGPLDIVPVVDRHYDTWISILGNPIVKLYLLVLISLPFFHFAHRLRYLLVDLGVHAAKRRPVQVVFYGGAVAVTLLTIWVLLTTAPISLG